MRRTLPARDQLLMRMGAAMSEAGGAFSFVTMQPPNANLPVTRQSFAFRLDKNKLREAELRDGHYLLRSNLTGGDPEVLWTRYIQLTQIEAAFRSLKSDLGIRPLYHQLQHPAHAPIPNAFPASCLQLTLTNPPRIHSPGPTPPA